MAWQCTFGKITKAKEAGNAAKRLKTAAFSMTDSIAVIRLLKTCGERVWEDGTSAFFSRKISTNCTNPRVHSLSTALGAYLVDCLLRLYAQSLHEPGELLWCNETGFLLAARPLEAPGFQPLIQQQEAIFLPEQPLDPVRSPATEQKQCAAFKGVQVVIGLHNVGKSIDARRRSVYPTAMYTFLNPLASLSIVQYLQHHPQLFGRCARVDVQLEFAAQPASAPCVWPGGEASSQPLPR